MTPTEIHPAIHSGYGLVEAPFEHVRATFGDHRRADQSTVSVLEPEASIAMALDHLGMRTHPATRLVLLDLDGWTGVLTNHRNGSDFADHAYWAGRTAHARTVRVVDSEARWWRRGRRRERLAWEARIFELASADGSPIRTISCANDGGRWSFDEIGEPLPIERAAPYEAERTRDRFTREQLRDLLAALGPGPLTSDRLVDVRRAALLVERIANDEWRARVEADACTLAEADDPAFNYFTLAMRTYVPHLPTHAASVIHLLEKAIDINPAYAPRARRHLAEARRIVTATGD